MGGYNLILDLDDTVYPFCDGVMKVLEKEGVAQGRTISQWDMHEDFDMERKEFWSLLSKDKHVDTIYGRKIPASTISELWRLRAHGHRIHFVTARTGALKERTIAGLSEQDVPYESILFTEDKGRTVDMLDAAFSLDDRPENYLDFDQDRHLAYLMEQPHNRRFRDGHPTVRRVKTMKDFADTVIGFQECGVQLRGRK